MSSVNIAKCKQTEILRLIMHCDKDLRTRVEHSNKHINKKLTHKNTQMGGSYEEVRKRFEDTLAELDSKPKANLRHDRVVAYAAECCIPQPDEKMDTEAQRNAWIAGIEKILKSMYPEIVFLAKYVHYDEVHEYLNPETGEHVLSRPHVHMYFMPVVDGKLNGKKIFPNRSSLRQFHHEVDELTKGIYGFSYGNGTKKKSFDTVEHLKLESEKAELEARRTALEEKEKELINRQVAIRQQEQIVEDREQQVYRREAKMMSFMNSTIGQKAIQEYNASIRTEQRPRGKKQGGKIGPVVETEIEIK